MASSRATPSSPEAGGAWRPPAAFHLPDGADLYVLRAIFDPRELVGQEPTMNIMFPVLLRNSDGGLLLLRLMVAVVFFTSGLSHLKDRVGRSKSIGASPAFTAFLGGGEVLGTFRVALGT